MTEKHENDRAGIAIEGDIINPVPEMLMKPGNVFCTWNKIKAFEGRAVIAGNVEIVAIIRQVADWACQIVKNVNVKPI